MRANSKRENSICASPSARRKLGAGAEVATCTEATVRAEAIACRETSVFVETSVCVEASTCLELGAGAEVSAGEVLGARSANGVCGKRGGGFKRGVRGGFTLIEIILSMTISAMIMFGCCALMFDMVNVLEFFERGWTLRSHVDGVEKFLRSSFMNSTFTKPSELGDTLASNDAKTLYLAHDPDSSTMGDYFLAFGSEREHPLFVSPFKFSPEKMCFLELDDDGLWIVWRFVLSEDKSSDPAIYRTKISQWVKEISFFYYDEVSGWEEDVKIRTSVTSSTLMPAYIKLVFEKEDEHIERIISLEGFLDYQITK